MAGKGSRSIKKKRRRFRLKKRARMTIASLLLVSALIVSLIPTQTKIQAYVDPTVDVMSLDGVISNYAVFDESDTSVTADSGSERFMAFPLLEEVTINDYNGSPHTYYRINEEGMTGSVDVPVFAMGIKTVDGGKYNALIDYIGYENEYDAETIDLTQSVCYNKRDDGELGTFYEKSDDNKVLYCTEEYSNYTDKLSNNYNILHIKKLELNYDPSDPEQSEWANEHPDPVTDDWYGHFGVIAGTDVYVDGLCFDKCSVDYLCDNSFEHATPKTISIPGELYELGNYTFKECPNLSEVRIGNKVKTIGRECFAGCGSLRDINIGDCSYLDTIGDAAFAKCGFSSLQLPGNANLKIGAGAFYGCYNLNDSLEQTEGMFARFAQAGSGAEARIGAYAYANCSAMTDMAMYSRLKSMTSGGNEDTEFEGLFAGCESLKHVELPATYGDASYSSSSAATLGQYTFQKCNSLEYVRFFTHNARPYDDYQFVTTSTLEYAKAAHENYDKPTVADSFVIWGPDPYPASSNEAAAHVSAQDFSNTYMYYDGEGNRIYELNLGGYVFNFNNGRVNKIIPTSGAKSSLVLPTMIGDVAINAIADYAYDGDNRYSDRLEKLTIPETIIRIGGYSFTAAEGLEKVYINTKGVEVLAGAFSNNPKLQYVRFGQTEPGGETTIGDKAFNNCPELLEVDFRDDAYDSDAIYDVNVTSIGTDAFKTNRQSSFNDIELERAGLNRLGSDKSSVSGLWLVMKGSTARDYVPYRFALNLSADSSARGGAEATGLKAISPSLDSGRLLPLGLCNLFTVRVYAATDGNKVSTKYNSYITYASGNPDNVSMRYNEDTGKGEAGITLITYPTTETTVGRTYDENGDATGSVYARDIIQKYLVGEELQYTERAIVSKLQNINIPDGVELIDETVNSMDATAEYLRGIKDTVGDTENGVNTITFNLNSLPDEEGLFTGDDYLTNVFFNEDVTHLGTLPFMSTERLSNVSFNAEGDKNSATKDNPYYWCENGIIYSYDGTDTTLEEVLHARGDATSAIPKNVVNATNDPQLTNVTKIAKGAFKYCEHLLEVDLSSLDKLNSIPTDCFYGCSLLEDITLPEGVNNIDSGAFQGCDSKVDVLIPGTEVYISPSAFDKEKRPTIITYSDSSAYRYALDNGINYRLLDNRYIVKFIDWDGTIVKSQYVTTGGDATPPEPDPEREGYTFTGWLPSYKNITDNTSCVAQYEQNSSSSSTSTTSTSSTSTTTTTSSSSTPTPTPTPTPSPSPRPSPSPTPSPTPAPTPGPTSSSTSTSSSSKSSSKSSSSSSSSKSNSSTVNSSTVPIVISGYASIPPSTGAGQAGSATGSTVPSGRTSVVSSAEGITDRSKMSANVNGSADNYVVKISENTEAEQAAVEALTGEFGSLNNIKYFPMDISLYDSTGNNKISPVPEGVTVSVTIPIPDELAIYGGNAKIASTAGGKLEKMTPKFTVINSVPCMNFTAAHFSPYVVYVDTANLSATGTLDSTPKTGDLIHPKWFLVIGLVMAALFMFLKKDKEELPSAA